MAQMVRNYLLNRENIILLMLHSIAEIRRNNKDSHSHSTTGVFAYCFVNAHHSSCLVYAVYIIFLANLFDLHSVQ